MPRLSTVRSCSASSPTCASPSPATTRPRYSELNRTLHGRLREISRHETAADLVHNLRNRAVAHQYRLAMMPGRSVESLEQHAAIVDAVVAGDESAAADAMDAHLGSVLDVLSRWGDVQ